MEGVVFVVCFRNDLCEAFHGEVVIAGGWLLHPLLWYQHPYVPFEYLAKVFDIVLSFPSVHVAQYGSWAMAVSEVFGIPGYLDA